MTNEIQKEGKFISVTKVVEEYLKKNPNGFIFEPTKPDDPNDLGNGWYNGYKNPWDLWNEPEDAEFEIIEPKQIENKS